jgi:hypothetical protein
MDAFNQANREETLRGHIVLSVEPTDASHQHDSVEANAPLKAMLDNLHLRKIDLADEVLVLNVGGYVGQSTAREVAYAIAQQKMLRWWDNRGDDGGWPLDGESYRRVQQAVEVATDGVKTIGRVR